MTIRLPKDVENSINAEVLSGHFASVDDAIAEAWRTFTSRKPEISPQAVITSAVTVSETVPTPLDNKPIWEVVDELRQSVPAEEWDKLPIDGAEQLDHYRYGSPKRPAR